jgi:hypothetical protein
MDVQQLDHVEHALAVTMPPEYRAIMLAYPFAPDSLAEELWLLDDPAELIEINLYYRNNGFFGIPWSTDYFAVGGDGLGNAHLLDLRSAPAPVLFADHETGEISPLASDTETWRSMLDADLEEIAADQRAMAEAREHKRWWQFWIR